MQQDQSNKCLTDTFAAPLRKKYIDGVSGWVVLPGWVWQFDILSEVHSLWGLGISHCQLLRCRITYDSQDGSREFIILLARISAIEAVLPPALIHQGESSLRDTWLEDWIAKYTAHFTVSPEWWSFNALGL